MLSKQELAVERLTEAAALISVASNCINEVLQDTDVGDEYYTRLLLLQQDLKSDIDAIASGEVYEFKE
jgi:hypothetical protein